MVFLSKCMLQSLYILVQILKGDNQINCWPISNRMVTHQLSIHSCSNCCSCRDEFHITNMSGKQILKMEHVLAALTLQSPDRNLLLLLPICSLPLLLLTLLLWFLFYRKLPLIFSLMDMFIYIKQLSCEVSPVLRCWRWSGFTLSLGHRSDIVTF